MKDRRDAAMPSVAEHRAVLSLRDAIPAGDRGPRIVPAAPRGRQRRLIVAAILLSIGAVAASCAFRPALDWLQRQARYQIPFRDIELSPPPPDWIRLDQTQFVNAVRERSGAPQTIHALSHNLADVARVFKLFPWVASVNKVELRAGNRPRVLLTYRNPIAQICSSKEPIILDRDGVVLPASECAAERLARLICISGLVEPFEARPGQTLVTFPSDRAPAEPDRKLFAAASLASFIASRDPRGVPRIARIAADFGPDGLILRLAGPNGLWVVWGPSDQTNPTAPPFEERWRLLREWAESHPDECGHAPEGKALYLDPGGARLRNVKHAAN